jgi:hypothetical protein
MVAAQILRALQRTDERGQVPGQCRRLFMLVRFFNRRVSSLIPEV